MSRTDCAVAGSILFSICVIYLYPLTLPTPLLEPDEGLHATISQEMLESREWLVPTFRGQPFLDKPILYFWAQMVSLKYLGSQEFAVRFPGLLFGVLGALTTGLLAAGLFDRRTGLLATGFQLTMMIPLTLAQAAVHDVAVVPWTNLALLSLWQTEHSNNWRRQTIGIVLTSLMFALAFLTKALIGVAVIGVGYAGWLLLSRRLATGSILRTTTALLLGAAAACPWFLTMESRSPGYLYYYFVERHVLGFATSTQRHGHEPWYFYLPWLALGTLPWCWYLIPWLGNLLQKRRSQRLPAPLLFLFCWLGGGILFLSTAHSKLVPYALPVFPAMAILCAVAWREAALGRLPPRWQTQFQSIVRHSGQLGVVLPIGLLLAWQLSTGMSVPTSAWLIAGVLGGLSWQIIRRFEPSQAGRSAALASVWMAGLAGLCLTWPLQSVAESYSERDLALWLNRQSQTPPQIVMVGESPHSVLFYLQPQLRQALRRDRMQSCTLPELTTRRTLPADTIIAVTQSRLSEHTNLQQSIPGRFIGTAGQFHLYRHSPSHPSEFQIARRSDP